MRPTQGKGSPISRASITGIVLLFITMGALSSGCIDTYFVKNVLWPPEPPPPDPTLKILANMSHAFVDTKASHLEYSDIATFQVKEGSRWIEISIVVEIDQNVPTEVMDPQADDRHVTVSLVHLEEDKTYVTETFTASDTRTFERVADPREGYWSVRIEAKGIGYTGPMGDMHSDSFVLVARGLVIE